MKLTVKQTWNETILCKHHTTWRSSNFLTLFRTTAGNGQEYEKQENARRTCPTGLREDEVQILKQRGKEDRSTTAVNQHFYLFGGLEEFIFP